MTCCKTMKNLCRPGSELVAFFVNVTSAGSHFGQIRTNSHTECYYFVVVRVTVIPAM